MLKKILYLIITGLFVITTLSGCDSYSSKKTDDKLTIITTLFPQYDFTKQIAGNHADVIMLLPAGVESHIYEPSPADMIKIENAHMFIYTGEHMEPWAQRIIDSIKSDVCIVDASKNIILDKTEELDDHDDVDAHRHIHQLNPHIWTDPILAKDMIDNITEGLCYVDSKNAENYKANANTCKSNLDDLDSAFKEIVSNATRDEIIFGGRFAFYYFTKRYGINYKSAYDSCSTESEPSVKRISELISEIKEKDIPVIYHEELVDPKIAKSISEQTGTKLLLLHSAHNVTQSDFDNGITYVDIMNQNAVNLKEGLQ